MDQTSPNNIWIAMQIIICFWFNDLACDSMSIFIIVLELKCILVLILVLPISWHFILTFILTTEVQIMFLAI